MNPLIQLKKAAPVFLVALVYFGLLSTTQAVVPAPDGDYPGQNTAEGQSALLHLAGGTYNTALGWASLEFNVTGQFNTATGAGTLVLNTGDENTATGAGALLNNTAANHNTADGAFALLSNTTGVDNTAIGDQALFSNTTANGNTADGTFALFSNTTGADNTAIGDVALVANTTGLSNTAIGVAALGSNTTGVANTAIGYNALLNNTTGGDNIALGDGAGFGLTTGNNNIDIGNLGAAAESGTIRIGVQNLQISTYIAGIYGRTTGSTVTLPVIVDEYGQLGTAASSERFKTEIKPMDKSSETILALKPVTFHYKSDKKDTPQYGLIAEQVAKVNPDLVVRDGNGNVYTVRYDAVNAMLLNEFLKEHRRIEEQTGKLESQARKIREQEASITQLKREMETVIAHSKEQDSQIQKVSAQLEASKPAPQVVNNP